MVRRRNGESSIPSSYGQSVYKEGRMNGSVFLKTLMNPHRFLVRLMNDEDEREISLANNEADSEFSEWKWAKPEEVIEQAVDYKRPTYEQVINSFGSYLNDTGRAAKCKSSKW